jgi:hypothetical protein
MDRWYDKLFGGRKSMHGFFAATLGLLAFRWIPVSGRLEALPYVLGFWALCFGFVAASNVYQKKVLNGGNGNGKP